MTDFTITNSPPGSAIADGTSTATSTVAIVALNGFTGSIGLTYGSTPTGISCTFTTSTIVDSGTASISCTSTTVNSYQVTVTASAGTLQHSSTATFMFNPVPTPDFTISATSPSPVAADGSTTASSTITVNYENGFTGTVELTYSSLPSAVSCTLTPTSLTNSGTATLSCKSSTAAMFPVHITGTGSTTHSTTTTFTFNPLTPQSFSVSSDHNALSIQQGSSGTETITVASSGGFSNTVMLSATVSPSGPTTTFTTTSIVNGYGTSTLTIKVANTVSTGTYTVTVKGDGGGQTHTTTIAVTVTAPQPAAPAPSSPTLIYAIIGVVIAAIAVGGGALYLRNRKPSSPAKPAKTP